MTSHHQIPFSYYMLPQAFCRRSVSLESLAYVIRPLPPSAGGGDVDIALLTAWEGEPSCELTLSFCRDSV